jgi:hypothetical protein
VHNRIGIELASCFYCLFLSGYGGHRLTGANSWGVEGGIGTMDLCDKSDCIKKNMDKINV